METAVLQLVRKNKVGPVMILLLIALLFLEMDWSKEMKFVTMAILILTMAVRSLVKLKKDFYVSLNHLSVVLFAGMD